MAKEKVIKLLILILAVAVIVPQITLANWWNPVSWGLWGKIWSFFHKQAPVVCTQEAKQCPDGSYVSRQGPKCEFAECPASADQTAGWKTYTNTQYGFEFKYPDEITFSSPSSTSRLVFILENKNKPAIGLYISLLEGSGENKLKQDKDLWQANSGTAESFSLQEITLGGNPAIKINEVDKTVSDTSGKVTQTANVILETFKGQYLYSFQCTQYGNDLTECNQIISTFKFITPVSQTAVELSLWPDVNSFDLVNKTFMAKGVRKTADVISNIKVYTNSSTKFYYVVTSGPYDGYHDFQWLYSKLKNWVGPEWWFTVKGTLTADSSVLATEIYYEIQ